MHTSLFKTKTFYVGLIFIAAGLIHGIFDGDWQGAVDRVLTGLALITGRDALSKLKKSEEHRVKSI